MATTKVAIGSTELIKSGLTLDSSSTSTSWFINKDNLFMHNSFNAGIGKLFALVTERNEAEFQV